MPNSPLVLTLFGIIIQSSIVVAQSNGITTKKDTLETPQSSTITTPGSVNTGETANTGLLSVDTALSVFVLQAISANQKEIELGRIAQKKTLNRDVKNFALKMAVDHSRLKGELISIARSRKIHDRPSREDFKDSLATLNEAEFNRAYIRLMVSDHEASINLFSKAAETVNDSQVKAFVLKTLPTLKKHYEMAQELSRELSLDIKESNKQ